MEYLFIIIFLIIGLFFFYHNDLNTSCDTKLDNIIKKLIRQSSRFAVASYQDKNPLIAVLHGNYGAGYLWSLKDIATTEQIKKATGIDFLEFENKIIEIQDIATKRLAKLCPEFAGEKIPLLSKLSGENI